MPTLYLELNAERMRESAARAEAAVRPLKTELRALDETSNQGTAALHNLAAAENTATAAARQLASGTATATSASLASAAATRAQAFAAGILHRAWTTVTRALIVTPVVALSLALAELGINAVKSALGLDDAADAADDYTAKVEQASVAVAELIAQQRRAADLGVSTPADEAISARISALKQARDALVALDTKERGARLSVEEAGQALGGGSQGYMSARRFMQVESGGFLGLGTEEYVKASDVVRALNVQIESQEAALKGVEAGEESAAAATRAHSEVLKARQAILAELVSGYNRLHGISAETERAMELARRAGLDPDLVRGAVSVYQDWAATVERLAAGLRDVDSASASATANAQANVDRKNAASQALLARIEASEGAVRRATIGDDAYAREESVNNIKALAQEASQSAAAVERLGREEGERIDVVNRLKAAERDAAKAAQDRAESISTLSNSLGAGMSTFIDSLGSGGDAVRAFAMSLANSLAQKGIDQLATSAATSFFAASSSTPGAPAPSYQHGGYNPVTQMALIHAGERVLNAEQTKVYDTGRAAPTQGRAGGSIQVHLHGITDAGGVRRSAYQLARQLERSQERRS